MALKLDLPEVRYAVAPITNIDVRDPSSNHDGTWTMSGYAAVFDQETVLYDGKFIRITETIDPAAFDRVLREQGLGSPAGVVHFNLGHDMNRAVAATDVPAGMPGSLVLRADASGLFYFARVPKDDPDGVAMASKMGTRVLAQASFAFTIARAEWTDTENDEGPDVSHRRILEIAHLYDVCACPQGAYAQTVSQLRSNAAAIGWPVMFEREAVDVPLVNTRGEIPVIPETGSRVNTRRLPADLIRRVAGHTKENNAC